MNDTPDEHGNIYTVLDAQIIKLTGQQHPPGSGDWPRPGDQPNDFPDPPMDEPDDDSPPLPPTE